MHCPRCSGLLVKDYMEAFEMVSKSVMIPCVKCLNCGHREDMVYQQNRRRNVLTELVKEAQTFKMGY